LHPHDRHHVIKELDFDPGLARIGSIALGFKNGGLSGIVCPPGPCCSQFLRIFDMLATPQT